MLDMIKELWSSYLFTPEGGAVSFILAALSVIGMWLVFKKAHKAGWRSLVPVLNLYTLVQIGDRHGLRFLLLLIPVVGFFYYILFSFRLARRFGKGGLFALGLILLPPLFMLALGFGSAKYKKS